MRIGMGAHRGGNQGLNGAGILWEAGEGKKQDSQGGRNWEK